MLFLGIRSGGEGSEVELFLERFLIILNPTASVCGVPTEWEAMLSIHIVRYRFYFHSIFLFGYFHQSNTPPILTTIEKLVKVL